MKTLDTAEMLDLNPLSRELQDAASELACRIEHGEFDDLDDMQMADIKGLATMLTRWATRARGLEHGGQEADAATTLRTLVTASVGPLSRN